MESTVILNQANLSERLAVCSWSLQPKNVDELIAGLKEIGIPRVQLALEPLVGPADGWGDTIARLRAAGVSIASGMMSCVGEDYTTIESIHRTGGVVPDDTWSETWTNFRKIAPIAAANDIRLVTLHAGFIPDDEDSYLYAKLVKRIAQISALFSEYGLKTGLETGQERAGTLLRFLQNVSEFDVGVNFDPANMLLYGSGEPIEALRSLLPFVKQVHIKDATRSPRPGVWGEEVVVGTGEVNWTEFFNVLGSGKFSGSLAIEREAGNNRAGDIRAAKEFLTTVVK
jgi:sugar phosphate isomerase/epimerase